MTQLSMRPCGDFRTTYKSDTPIFETKTIRSLAIAGVIAMLAAPLVLDIYAICRHPVCRHRACLRAGLAEL